MFPVRFTAGLGQVHPRLGNGVTITSSLQYPVCLCMYYKYRYYAGQASWSQDVMQGVTELLGTKAIYSRTCYLKALCDQETTPMADIVR